MSQPIEETFPPLLSRLLTGGGGDLFLLSDQAPELVRERVSREVLRARSAGAAASLARAGVARGDRVVLCLPTSIEFVAWFLGALRLGAVAVPMPAPSGVRRQGPVLERLVGAVRDCAPSALVAEPRDLPWLAQAVPGAGAMLAADALDAAPPPSAAQMPDIATAFLQYTAGSTGTPKGVMVTLGNVRANLEAIGAAVEVSSEDRVVSWLPLYHDMGLVGTLLFSLYWRLPLYLFSPWAFALRPTSWLRAISQHRGTLTAAPHFAYGLCAFKVPESDLQGLDLGSLRLALDGAEPVKPAAVQRFVSRFAPYGFRPEAYHPVYGMSEATLAVAFPGVREGARVDRVLRSALEQGRALPAGSSEPAAELVSVGAPLAGHAIEIRHPRTGAPCAEREIGEIVIRGPSVSPGYFRLGDPEPPRAELRTGDLGYLAEGRLYVVDRLKDLIIHAGQNLFPSDIEHLVSGVPGVRRGRVAAFGVPIDDGATEGVVVALESRRLVGAEALRKRVRQMLQQTLAITPEDVCVLTPRALPVTMTGKLRRGEARRAYLAGELESAHPWLQRMGGELKRLRLMLSASRAQQS